MSDPANRSTFLRLKGLCRAEGLGPVTKICEKGADRRKDREIHLRKRESHEAPSWNSISKLVD